MAFDINSYLNTTCTINCTPLRYEDSALLGTFENFAESLLRKEIKIISINSSDVFPRRVTVNNNSYIFWDLHLIDLLTGLNHITHGLLNTDETTPQEIINLCKNKNYFFFYSFLSYQLKSISTPLSIYFTRKALEMNSIINGDSLVFPEETERALSIILLFQKYYIFTHEIFHEWLINDADRFEEELKLVKVSLGIKKDVYNEELTEWKSNPPSKTRKQSPLYRIGSDQNSNDVNYTNYLLKQIEILEKEDKKNILIELICDIRSTLMTWEYIKNDYEQDTKEIDEIFIFLMIAIHTAQTWLKRLLIISRIWKDIAYDINFQLRQPISIFGLSRLILDNFYLNENQNATIRFENSMIFPMYIICQREFPLNEFPEMKIQLSDSAKPYDDSDYKYLLEIFLEMFDENRVREIVFNVVDNYY